MRNSIEKSMVLMGLSALAYLGYSDFNPAKTQVAMIHGTNTTFYKDQFDIKIMNNNIFEYKVKMTNGIRHYSVERLFVELSRFPTEDTIKQNIIKSISKDLIPAEVNKIYNKIKNNTRGIDFTHVREYLEKNYIDIEKIILNNPLKADDYIREYILSILGDNDMPVLLKGGSAIELFIGIKRSTKDIDLLSEENGMAQSLNILTNNRAPIYLKLDDEIEERILQKRIVKLELKLYSISKKLNDFFKATGSKKHQNIKITFNNSLDKDEINDIKKTYQLSKRQLHLFKNKSIITFSKEMLLAEKYHSLIDKPENTKRAKDLFDLNELGIKNINWEKFYKWLFRRFSTSKRNPLNQKDALERIKENKDKELSKIKLHWSEGQKTYVDKTIRYEDALDIYKSISKHILKDKS